MTKTQRDSIIAVVMVAAFIASAVRMVRLQKQRHPAPAAAFVASASSSVEAQLLDDARFIGTVRETRQTADNQAGRWNQEWERDPFRAEEASGSSVENLVLSGVFWDQDTPRAIINGKQLRPGESIDGYKVMEIRHRSVMLWTGEKNLELKVFRSPFEQGPPSDEDAPAAAPAAPEAAKAEGPQVSEELVAKGRDFIKPDSFLAKLPGAEKLNKSLKTVDAFATDTSGAEAMMQMMGSTPEQIKQNLTVKDPKAGSSDKS